MKPRPRDDLGPAREAERSRLLLELRARSPKRPSAPQEGPAALELFAATLEPGLF